MPTISTDIQRIVLKAARIGTKWWHVKNASRHSATSTWVL